MTYVNAKSHIIFFALIIGFLFSAGCSNAQSGSQSTSSQSTVYYPLPIGEWETGDGTHSLNFAPDLRLSLSVKTFDGTFTGSQGVAEFNWDVTSDGQILLSRIATSQNEDSSGYIIPKTLGYNTKSNSLIDNNGVEYRLVRQKISPNPASFMMAFKTSWNKDYYSNGNPSFYDNIGYLISDSLSIEEKQNLFKAFTQLRTGDSYRLKIDSYELIDEKTNDFASDVKYRINFRGYLSGEPQPSLTQYEWDMHIQLEGYSWKIVTLKMSAPRSVSE